MNNVRAYLMFDIENQALNSIRKREVTAYTLYSSFFAAALSLIGFLSNPLLSTTWVNINITLLILSILAAIISFCLVVKESNNRKIIMNDITARPVNLTFENPHTQETLH